jgi:NADPH:quinone reductase-like Zn-dependent oxidoreductase
MKAARLLAYGDVDQFKFEDAPDPVPGAGEALIRISAAGLNPVDAYVRQGFFAKYAPLQFPAILGVDAAGTIVALGAGLSDFAVGDRVVAHLPLNGKGGYAEQAAAPVAGLAKLPANVSFEAGATLPLAALTGQQAVDALGVKPGDRVLVSGALGAVGRAAVQYLKELGARPVAGVRGTRLGEGEKLAGEALDIEQAPASPSFDFAVAATGPAVVNTIKRLRDGGKLASVVQIPEGANEGGRVSIASLMAHDDPAILQRAVSAAARGELTIPVAAKFKLSEVREAHRALAAGSRGKILLTI